MNTAKTPIAPARPRLTRRTLVAALSGLVGLAALPRWARSTPVEPPLEIEIEPDPDPRDVAWEVDGRDAVIFGADALPETGRPSRFFRVIRYAPGDRSNPNAHAFGDGGERLALQSIPRWLSPEVLKGDQPEPLRTTFLKWPGSEANGMQPEAGIVRTWDAFESRYCRLCRRCTASREVGSFDLLCIVPLPAEVAAGPLPSIEDAAFWCQGTAGPLPEADRQAVAHGGEHD